MTRQAPPTTDSIQELAEFWDSHDLTDYEDELEEVTEPVFGRSAVVVEVELEPIEATAVGRLARSKGIGSAELIHEWVRQRVAAGDSDS